MMTSAQARPRWCEHVDNAIQWGATELRVYFRQSGKKGAYETDVLALDNGSGISA